MKRIKHWTPYFVGLLVMLLIALFLRIKNLTILPVFVDEAIYIRWSQIMANEPTLRFLPLSDGKQPLFMWILMFMVRSFSNPLVAGRILSVFTGIGILIGVAALSYYYYKSKLASLAASFLWAVSPFSLFFDRMALVDSMLAFFTVWTLLFASITAKTKRIDTAMVTGFLLGGAALTKSPALFVAIMLPSTWILSKWSKYYKRKAVTIIKLAGLTMVTIFIAFVMYNIQRLGPNFGMLSSRTQDYVFPLSHLWTNPKDPFIFLFHRSLQWLWIMGPWELFLLVIPGIVLGFIKNRRTTLVLLLWFLFPLLVQTMFAKVFTARYIFYTLPPLYVIASRAFLIPKKYIGFMIIVLGIFTVHALQYDLLLLTNPERANLPRGERSGYLEEWTAGTGIFEVSSYIKDIHYEDPDRHIVIGTEGYFGTLPDGLQMYLEGLPDTVVVGVGLGIKETPSTLKTAFKAGDRAYLVVNSSRLKIPEDSTYEDIGLKKVLEFPKAARPDGYKEFVQYGERDYLYLFEVVRIPEKSVYDNI